MSKALKIMVNGIIKENPVIIQVVGLCATLATSTSIYNGLGMGLATTAVLVCSNVVIAAIRKFIPNTVRIPCFIVVIASFVTIVQLLMKAYVPALDKALGLFIPLIVVNCIILARAEAFASKNSIWDSFWDGIGNGIGFTLVLVTMGFIREIIGGGTLLSGTPFAITVLPEAFPKTLLFIMSPGAFFTLGCIMALFKFSQDKKAEKAKLKEEA